MTIDVHKQITLYRGAAEKWARIAAHWLTKADVWTRAEGPMVNEGISICLDCHGRAVRNARALVGGGEK
jgi:thioredoxin reductase